MKYFFVLTIFVAAVFAQHGYHGVAFAPDGIHGWVVCIDTPLIYYTTDGGVTWTEQQPDSNSKRFFDIACVDESNAWTCGILGEIQHTNNGGVDWTRQTIGLSKYITRVEFLDQNTGWAVGGDGALGRTTDGGAYWDNIFLPYPWYVELYGISFLNEADLWMVSGYPDSLLPGQGFIFSSSDSGLSWDSVYQVTGYEDFFDIHFFNLLEGIVIGGNESDTSALIWKTTSAGNSWTPITPPPNTYYLRALDFVDDLEGWAVGRFGTIIHTTDAGDTWTFQTNPATTTLFDIEFADNNCGIACGQDIILYTTNGGQTWNGVGVEEHIINDFQTISFSVYPNPCSKNVFIKLQIPNSTPQDPGIMSRIDIYDISGRSVKSFSVPSSYYLVPTALQWDCTDEHGNIVPAGIYIVRMEGNLQAHTSPIIVIH